MTFRLKDLNELREHFIDTVDILLEREKKGKIEDLANPRKYELQFLTSILIKLEQQPQKSAKEKNPPPPSATDKPSVFYGAMLAIMKDIETNRGLLNSAGLLHGRLVDAIGIGAKVKKEEKPDLYQNAKFHVALNTFLKQIFVDNDSRKGFAKEHMLLAVPTDELSTLIKISYKLEKECKQEIINAMSVEGTSTAKANNFDKPEKYPASLTKQFVSWASMITALNSLIKKELAAKNVSNINELKNPHRAAQLHFLNIIKDTLQPSNLSEHAKMSILAGAMHLVRQQISAEYAASYISKSDNSVIYHGLTMFLGVDEVSHQDTEELISAANQFVRFMTIDSVDNGKKFMTSTNLFSSISGFDLKANLSLFIEMIHTCRADALDIVVENFKKDFKGSEKAATGLGATLSAFSPFALFRGKKDSSVEIEPEALEHKVDFQAN